jgi:hypothetical protein
MRFSLGNFCIFDFRDENEQADMISSWGKYIAEKEDESKEIEG